MKRFEKPKLPMVTYQISAKICVNGPLPLLEHLDIFYRKHISFMNPDSRDTFDPTLAAFYHSAAALCLRYLSGASRSGNQHALSDRCACPNDTAMRIYAQRLRVAVRRSICNDISAQSCIHGGAFRGSQKARPRNYLGMGDGKGRRRFI